MGLYIPPVDKYLKACMFQHAALLGFAMDSWCDKSGTSFGILEKDLESGGSG